MKVLALSLRLIQLVVELIIRGLIALVTFLVEFSRRPSPQALKKASPIMASEPYQPKPNQQALEGGGSRISMWNNRDGRPQYAHTRKHLLDSPDCNFYVAQTFSDYPPRRIFDNSTDLQIEPEPFPTPAPFVIAPLADDAFAPGMSPFPLDPPNRKVYIRSSNRLKFGYPRDE